MAAFIGRELELAKLRELARLDAASLPDSSATSK
jgi:hypothetical protein